MHLDHCHFGPSRAFQKCSFCRGETRVGIKRGRKNCRTSRSFCSLLFWALKGLSKVLILSRRNARGKLAHSCAYTCTELSGSGETVAQKYNGEGQHVAITTSITTTIVPSSMFEGPKHIWKIRARLQNRPRKIRVETGVFRPWASYLCRFGLAKTEVLC